MDYLWNKESGLHQVTSVYCSFLTFVFSLDFSISRIQGQKILSDGQDQGLTMSLSCPAFHFSSPPLASGE